MCPFIEDAALALSTIRGDRPSLLVVDSAQQVESRAGVDADGPRAKLTANVAALRRAAHWERHLVLATSELARGAYRSKNTSERIDDLAAFKESGALEYGADLALVLRSVRNEDDSVDATVPKSRLGPRTPFRLRLDRRAMRFGEVKVHGEDEDRQRDAAENAQMASDVRTVERYLSGHPGTPGLKALRTGLRAEGAHLSNPRIDVALVRLKNRIENRGKETRPAWHLRPSTTAGAEDIPEGDAG